MKKESEESFAKFFSVVQSSEDQTSDESKDITNIIHSEEFAEQSIDNLRADMELELERYRSQR